tara:strand:- start:11261 stop:14254 length:2994 start_codon:yes stop_codon:yes gene_type:complete
MEISKDHSIFSIIEKHSSLAEEDCYSYIKMTNTLSWNDIEYENFINVMKSMKYIEEIEPQILEVYAMDIILKISGNANIIKYCQNNKFKSKNFEWYKNKVISKDVVNDLLDSNLNFYSVKNNVTTDTNIPTNWNDIRKYFKVVKNIKYTDPETQIKYIVSITKGNDIEYDETKESEMFNSLINSGILATKQKYEFYIDITNTEKDNILPALIKMEQSLHLSSFIISKIQQQEIINKYYELIKNDIIIKSFNNRNPNRPPLITPKPVTLEKINILNPDEYGIVSILSEYTVTEKADGERLLMFIDDNGKVYLINNTYRVTDTGITTTKELHNTLIDGEYIGCNNRNDFSSKGLYAAFDIYYYSGDKITSLPLIDNDQKINTRYKYLLKTVSQMKHNEYSMDYIVKEHLYNSDILKDCEKILSGNKVYPYDIDGLIFTPAKLALYSYYTNKAMQITDNVKWDRVFKWKPPEQNTIDFLAKQSITTTIDGIKYKEFLLYVGYNASQWVPYTIDDALKIAYNKEYRIMVQDKKKSYIPKLFQPNIFYEKGIEKLLVRIDSNGKAKCDSGEILEGDMILECIYNLDSTIPANMRWKPMRIREDKNRIYKMGELSKTANDMSVAINIWRSIHNPVTESIIRGNKPIADMDVNNSESERLLEADDIYYSRNIPRDAMFSYNMLQFHNLGIKRMLYSKPKNKNNIVELACGEGGDMSRWIDNGYKFILGIDLVKKNIYGPTTGAYSRMLENRKKFFRNTNVKDKLLFPNMVFVTGDCGKSIMDGECSLSINDQESYNILQTVLNKRKGNMQKHYSYIIGQGSDGFDVCSCMFSIHYFFKSEETLDTYLMNVSSLLRKDGTFLCTFMDGKRIEDEINSTNGDTIEGIKNNEISVKNSVPIWAIIRRYNKDDNDKYNRKIDVFIESTSKFIPEYLVSYELLVEKCKSYNLELVESELFSEYFNKIKEEIPDDDNEKENIHKIVTELDKDPVQKKFSFFNRWCVFKKI